MNGIARTSLTLSLLAAGTMLTGAVLAQETTGISELPIPGPFHVIPPGGDAGFGFAPPPGGIGVPYWMQPQAPAAAPQPRDTGAAAPSYAPPQTAARPAAPGYGQGVPPGYYPGYWPGAAAPWPQVQAPQAQAQQQYRAPQYQPQYQPQQQYRAPQYQAPRPQAGTAPAVRNGYQPYPYGYPQSGYGAPQQGWGWGGYPGWGAPGWPQTGRGGGQ